MDAKVAKPKVVPFSLKDAPSLIERVWPAQKISVEAQKERKANLGQTLTGLGSYWKGRKPLVLVRACVLGALLPSTGSDEKDLEIFEILMGMSDDQIIDRFGSVLTLDEIKTYATPEQRTALLDDVDGESSLRRLPKAERTALMSTVLAQMPYIKRVDKLVRPEEVSEEDLTGSRMGIVNRHLGTSAGSLRELVEQLGIMRFGHRPRVGDTFSGSGSIPFEAARLGCDAFASDLNPVACMLTWGGFHIIGGSEQVRTDIEEAQSRVARRVDDEITDLGIEHDSQGNRAKVYLYCLETRCPKTGWVVPIAPSWIISKTRNVAAVLIPNHKAKRFDIEIRAGATKEEMAAAGAGTLRDSRLVYTLDGESYSTPIRSIRGDRREPDGETINDLRRWKKHDFIPAPDDVLQERLYCIQWITAESLGRARPDTFFASVTPADLAREAQVNEIVRENIEEWQENGLIPDMPIETGKENEGPIRTNGWTYWHQLFNARQLHLLALTKQFSELESETSKAALWLAIAKCADNSSRSTRWDSGFGQERIANTFSDPSLKTISNYACRAFKHFVAHLQSSYACSAQIESDVVQTNSPADVLTENSDYWITDPPYADSVNYHEITEFFIAWLRKDPPQAFRNWIWDSRRPLAIKGDGEDFRHNMVAAYRAMSNHMPENGLQVVMFTHQSAAVWADMAQIFWGAGLQVMAAWYIATETTSELKKGGYVQGTVILVARKRKASEAGYKDEIVQEVRAEVADQINTMAGLNQHLKGHGRIENLFEDADLQMAGYAAALRVLTKYEKIDGTDMTKEALRLRRDGEKNLVGEIIDFAVQVANEHMVPEHMAPKLWEGLSGPERFYLKMMDIETTSLRKLDNYQNFAKAFRVNDYGALMGSLEPNKARLRTAKEFKKTGFEIPEFGPSATRGALYAIFELENDVEGDDVLSHLKDMLPNYHNKRDDLAAIAEYIARKREAADETESRAARILHGLIRNERLG
jgi:putative DNA methylase